MSVPFRVLVYEYYTGGGSSEGTPPEGLAREALGILWALLADFRSWGGARTVTVLDTGFEECVPGLNRHTLPADEVVTVPPNDSPDIFHSLLKRCDAALVVAPESDGILAGLTAEVEREGIRLLGSGAAAAATAGDKEACGKLLSLAGLPVPETCAADFNSAARIAREMGFPLVLKPPDGVACEGVCLASGPSDLSQALEHLRTVTSRDRILLQPFVDGIHASVSLLVSGNRCVPLSLNRQLIRSGIPFEYSGSEVPFGPASGVRAMELAAIASGAVAGLKGYVGVDLVIAGDSVQLIEINPRITTSYIGLRRVSGLNPAKMIYEACAEGVLPESVPLKGPVVVRKDDPFSWGFKQGA